MDIADCKRGIIVTLALPNSPLMVVIGESVMTSGRVTCTWFDTRGRIQTSDFGPDLLTVASAEPSPGDRRNRW